MKPAFDLTPLRHPMWWFALALLLVNDNAWKGSGVLPGWLTGKLSDFAFLIVAPVLAFVCLPCGLKGRRALSLGSVTAVYVACDHSRSGSDAVVALAARVRLRARVPAPSRRLCERRGPPSVVTPPCSARPLPLPLPSCEVIAHEAVRVFIAAYGWGLLLHAAEFTARMLERLLTAYEENGVRLGGAVRPAADPCRRFESPWVQPVFDSWISAMQRLVGKACALRAA